MYTSLLDSVRFSSDQSDVNIQMTYAEGILFSALLNGQTPMLALPQVFDSGLILKLSENKHFLEAISKGYIGICLFGGADSVHAYIVNVIKGNIRSHNSDFRFSSLPFLSEVGNPKNQNVFEKLLSSFQDGQVFSSGDLNRSQNNLIKGYYSATPCKTGKITNSEVQNA